MCINVILAGLSEYEHLFVLSGPQIIKPYLPEYQDPSPILIRDHSQNFTNFRMTKQKTIIVGRYRITFLEVSYD